MIAELGVDALLLLQQVNAALEANDRGKYLLTLLQAARSHCDDASMPAATLAEERLAAGIADRSLDTVVAASRREPDGAYLIPGAGRVHQRLLDEVAAMLIPVRIAGADGEALGERLDAIVAEVPAGIAADRVSGSYLDRIASAQPEQGDSVHRLIMDAHRALNRLQASIATESLDGAAVYGLDDGDRALVRAFVAGVRRTSSLRFDHPGLGTTATRSGRRLIIQNDIGATQAHVIDAKRGGPSSAGSRSSEFSRWRARSPMRWSAQPMHSPGRR